MSDSPIVTERLLLVPMSVPFLEASLAGDLSAATALLSATVPSEWLGEQPFVALRLRQLRRDPALQPWLLRAIIHRVDDLRTRNASFVADGRGHVDGLG